MKYTESNLEQLFIPVQGTQGALHCVDLKNPLQKVFKHVYTVYTYSNCSINQLHFRQTIAARQRGFIVPNAWKVVVRKNLTNFEGCHFAWIYILIWWSFPKIETKNSTRAHVFWNLLNWERYHLLHISLTAFTLEEVRRQQEWFVVFLLENFL